jgi:hypothetical protein
MSGLYLSECVLPTHDGPSAPHLKTVESPPFADVRKPNIQARTASSNDILFDITKGGPLKRLPFEGLPNRDVRPFEKDDRNKAWPSSTQSSASCLSGSMCPNWCTFHSTCSREKSVLCRTQRWASNNR